MLPSPLASPASRRFQSRRSATAAAWLLAGTLHAQQTQQFLAQRQTTNHTSPALALQHARAQHQALGAQPLGTTPHDTSLTANWTPLGPASIVSPTFGNLTGRITALALDPNDATANTLFLGTTGGGVFKSTNAAATAPTFTPLTDTLPVFAAGTAVIPSLSIGAVAVQPAPDPILLAGTGDPNDASDSYYGEGILRSADNGLTWTLIQQSSDGANGHHSFNGLATAAIAFSTATPTLAVAAFSTSAESATVEATISNSIPGLYYSTDAGNTWQMATLYDGAQIVQQPLPIGTTQSGNAATAVVWNPIRKLFFAAIRAHGYYSSPDGITWTRLATQPGTNLTNANCPVGVNGVGAATCPIFRGALAVQPVTGDTYALTVDANNLDQGLWQDRCNATANACTNAQPAFATRIDNNALDINSAIQQGAYNLTLAAIPAATSSTTTNLYAGTTDLYRCVLTPNSSVCTLRNTTNARNGCATPAAVAPAQHAIAALQQSTSGPILFLGNDGGLWRSLDGVAETGPACSTTDATHFTNLNQALGAGGSLAEITGFAQHPTDPQTLLAGLGSNGSAATTAALPLTPWPQLSAGEGGQPLLDPNTPTNWLLSIGAGVDLAECTLGANCTAANFTPPATIGEPQVSDDATVLDAPTLLDPSLTTNVLVGTCRVWRGPAASGATWSTAYTLSPAFAGPAVSAANHCTTANPLIRSLAAGGPANTSTNPQSAGSKVIYAGLAGATDGGLNLGGAIFFTATANTASAAVPWTNLAANPVTNDTANAGHFNPYGFDISSIAVDPHDPTGATVYATIMGFASAPHLYRSTDFGAHWLNISANLPSAPANAVVIDPNDANTLYVALDTGVYATRAVTTCAVNNCWSVLGTGLPNAPVTTLAAAASMPTGDGRLGLLRAGTYGRGLWEVPLLTAQALAQPALTLSATSFTFTAQQVGTQSPTQTLTVTNSGTAPATFTTPAITGDFAISADTCTGTLAANASCILQLAFAPTATGTRTGQLTLYANIPGGQATATLTGLATAPASITLTPLSLTFVATIVNQTTTAQNITVANTGGATTTLQTPIITGDFVLSANTCGATLSPSTSCTLSIEFQPSASGLRTGTLSLTDSAGTQIAELSGTGQAPATDTLTPTSLTFAQQQIGTASAAQQLTLTNAGDVPLTLITTAITPGDFTVTSACGNSLAAHATCAIGVNFIPTATGTRTATLTVSDQFRAQTVALTGTAVAPPGVSLTPATLSYAPIGVGLSSPPQTLTLTNNGGLPLTISSTTLSPNFAITSSTCTTTLAPAAACTLQIVFAPTTPGTQNGTLTLTDNAPNPTQVVNLFGTGIDFTFTPNGPTTQTVASGTPAQYSLLLSSLSSLTGNVAFTCTGAPTYATCTVSPATGTLGGTNPIVVTVATGLAALRYPTLPWLPTSTFLFALTLPLTLLNRRKPRSLIHLVFALTVLATITACGAGRSIPPSTSTNPATPTPPGTYTLTVSATTAGLTHTVPLTLTVQ